MTHHYDNKLNWYRLTKEILRTIIAPWVEIFTEDKAMLETRAEVKYHGSLMDCMKSELPDIIEAKKTLEEYIDSYHLDYGLNCDLGELYCDMQYALGIAERAANYIRLIPREELYMLQLRGIVDICDNVLTHEFFDYPILGDLRDMYEESTNALDVIDSYLNVMLYLFDHPEEDARYIENFG